MRACCPRAGRVATDLNEVVPAATDLLVDETPSPSAGAPRVVPRRVLVVDDEHIVADTVAEMLRTVGHDVDVETVSSNVLDRLAAAQYDVIISDVRMPTLDGPALWAAVRQRYPELGDRMIFVTGDLGRSDTRRFLAEAGVESLAKPVRARAVRDMVERVTRA